MSLSPADWLGLAGSWHSASAEATLRWALLALALAWAWRARCDQGRGPSLALGALFTFVAAAFWISALGRPHGLILEPKATRRTAQIAVTAATGDAEQGPVTGTPALSPTWAEAALIFPEPFVILLPSMLPALLPTVMAATILVFWGRRVDAPLGATLWLAVGTGNLDGLGDRGFVPGLWPRPEAGLLLPPVVALVLVAARLRPRGASLIAGFAASSLLLLPPARGSGLGVADVLRADLLDQGLLLWLGGFGLWKGRDRAAALLLLVGCALSALGLTTWALDGWAAHALIRLGLVLASPAAIRDLLVRVPTTLPEWPSLRSSATTGSALAGLLAIGVPSSVLAWWRPVFQDAYYAASLDPLPARAHTLAEWIRSNAPSDAVFAAGPEDALWIAALGGRRVLWAPTLGMPSDLGRRRQVQKLALALEDPGRAGRRYGLSHVALGPYAGSAQSALARSGPWRCVWDASGWRVYEIGAPEDETLE